MLTFEDIVYNDDDDDIQTKEEEEAEDFGFFYDDLKVLVHHYIDRFFDDKHYHSGGPIPNKFLHSPRYLNMVMDYDICNGIDFVYGALDGQFAPLEVEVLEKKGQLPEDVKYVIGLFDKCAQAGVPKAFCVGIALMHLELCDGYKVKL